MKTGDPLARLPAVIFFLLAISLPLADGILHFGAAASRNGRHEMEQKENRPVDPPSSFYPNRGRIFSQRFFLRRTLIHISNSLKFLAFGVSGVPKVIIGRQGWLFQARENKPPGAGLLRRLVRAGSVRRVEFWGKVFYERG
ncbi:MAG: hypothetical protein R6X14_02975 [bacterium]